MQCLPYQLVLDCLNESGDQSVSEILKLHLSWPSQPKCLSHQNGADLPWWMGGLKGPRKRPDCPLHLVMSRPCRKACILIKKGWHLWWVFFSRYFACFKSISPKKHIYCRVYKRILKQNPRKILVWTNQWDMISCDRVQQDRPGRFETSPFRPISHSTLKARDSVHHLNPPSIRLPMMLAS